MKLKLSLLEAKFTNVDFLLNIGQLQRVALILSGIQKQLGQVYHKGKLEAGETPT